MSNNIHCVVAEQWNTASNTEADKYRGKKASENENIQRMTISQAFC